MSRGKFVLLAKIVGAASIAALVGPTTAAVGVNVNPFGNVTGTPTVGPADGQGSGWRDANINNAPYSSVPTFYSESWATPKSVATVVLDTHDRQADGTITVQTTNAGPWTSIPAGSFSLNANLHSRFAINQVGIYGVRIDVTSSTTNANQYKRMGDVEFLAIPTGPNLALGMTQLNGPGSGSYNTGPDPNIHNEILGGSWRAGAVGDNWVGLSFAPGQAEPIKAVRVSSVLLDETWSWKNYHIEVQYDPNAVVTDPWFSVSPTANVPANQTTTYFDFTNDYGPIHALRIRGNTSANQEIVDDIMVFGWLPEPASTGVLALAGLALNMRRSRRR